MITLCHHMATFTGGLYQRNIPDERDQVGMEIVQPNIHRGKNFCMKILLRRFGFVQYFVYPEGEERDDEYDKGCPAQRAVAFSDEIDEAETRHGKADGEQYERGDRPVFPWIVLPCGGEY